jgi:GNAT superfamily N-acetyltransferase
VQLRAFEHPEAFLEAASSLLDEDEPRHNLVFGICSTLIESPQAHPAFRSFVVEAGGDVVAAAMMTPPFNIVVPRPRDPAALVFLPEADDFAAAWEAATGVERRTRMRLGIYQATAARPPDGVPGAMRFAGVEDRALCVDWWRAFEAESLAEGAARTEAEANVDRRLAGVRSGIALWEDAQPVSAAGFGGPTPNGIRIGPVYTPPALRRRGYASALVARLTEHLLRGDTRFCFLYTDLANPTSNRIYQDVGYEWVAESVDYVFREPG